MVFLVTRYDIEHVTVSTYQIALYGLSLRLFFYVFYFNFSTIHLFLMTRKFLHMYKMYLRTLTLTFYFSRTENDDHTMKPLFWYRTFIRKSETLHIFSVIHHTVINTYTGNCSTNPQKLFLKESAKLCSVCIISLYFYFGRFFENILLKVKC